MPRRRTAPGLDRFPAYYAPNGRAGVVSRPPGLATNLHFGQSVAAARSLTRRVDLPVISTIAGETLILLQEIAYLLVTRRPAYHGEFAHFSVGGNTGIVNGARFSDGGQGQEASKRKIGTPSGRHYVGARGDRGRSRRRQDPSCTGRCRGRIS